MKNIIFLDLDGTLINPRNRYLSIYKKLCKDAGTESLHSNIYWKLKRNKIPEYDMCGCSTFYAPRSHAAPLRSPDA